MLLTFASPVQSAAGRLVPGDRLNPSSRATFSAPGSLKRAGASSSTIAVALGLAATLAILALHLGGLDRRWELQALDKRFAWLPTAPPNDRLVHIDIDDRSLGELGRWPWPRAQLAGIVATLHDAGAKSVALDIIMPEPQETRYVAASTQLYSADFGELIGAGPPQPVFDDSILAETLQAGRRVSLPMHISPWAVAPTPLDAQVAKLTASPGTSLQSVLAQVTGHLPPGKQAEQADAVMRAYLRARSLASLARFAIAPAATAGYPHRVGVVTPPLVTLAQACYRSGFVTFDPDVDGVVRRIPMLAGDGKLVFPQFALALSADELAGDHGGPGGISADATAVTIRCDDGYERRIPIDRDGHMLINWVRPRDEHTDARHISAAKIGSVWLLRESLRQNRDRRNLLNLSLLSMANGFPSETVKELYWKIVGLDRQAGGLHEEIIAARHRRQRALLLDPGNVPPASTELAKRADALDAEISELCDKFRKQIQAGANLAVFLGGVESDDYQANRHKAEFLLDQIDLVAESNANIEHDLAAQLAELRKLVGGKLCLIGSIATGAADFVPTPVSKRMPGVWVHANILNTIVSGVFIRQAPQLVNLAAILLTGLAVALLAGTRPVLLAAPVTVLLAGGYVAGNALIAFATLKVWLVVAAPLAAMLAAFLTVTAFRQLTEERAKRRIRGMFAQALSPALVDRLIEDPSLAKLGGERRELTFFFSDLQGFTPLAERLGEELTVKLLNMYFDRMTDVIQNRRGGYLNKFLGDGLFVFFGAPVFQKDHAARAIRAALDCQGETAILNGELADRFPHDVELACRIGIATGDVMVGNCGSSHRMDYTAIGDPVNVASRLESAGKFFGVQILISDVSWQQGGCDDLLARPLGKVIVVGKKEPVKLWHLLCEKSQADQKLFATYELFAEGVDLFGRGDFAGAAKIMQQCLIELPDDRPAEVFLKLCRDYISTPPSDWDGVLRLTEK